MNIPHQGHQDPNDMKLQNMTHQQLKRIQKSMKRPQFMGLLNQYMVQISDPKNRQQYDQYLRQMQRQGQLPKHMRLVELTPHFCIRTNIVSEKNKKHNMKFFINFCSTEYLDEPGCEPSLNEEGKAAYGWKVPNSMGKIRYDQDKNGNPCQVADVAFNHKAFEIVEAESNLPFRKNQFKSMLIMIGLQCAEKQLGERKETLSKDYDILKNLKCKGGKPALLPLRYIKGKAYNKGESPQQNQIQRDTQGRQTKLQKQIQQMKQKAQEQKKKDQTSKDQIEEMQQQLSQQKKLIQDLDAGIQQPKYSSIYTYPIDYSQYLQDQSYNKASKVPSHFNVELKLPRVQGMQQIGGDALNINENRIILKVGEKYFIDLGFDTFKLKYKLLTDRVKAKFDKKKKVLRLVFPVDQTVRYHQEEELNQQALVKEDEGQQKVDDTKEDEVVQNQTWKNKLLQVSEPGVDLKIIDNQQAQNQEVIQQPQKKLIQQIDQDDYPQELKQNQTSNQTKPEPQSFEQALEQQKNHAFSLRKYYQPKQGQLSNQQTQQNLQLEQRPNQLTYVFQETSDKVVLVVKMANYKKEELKVVYDELENNNFFIQWNLNQSEQKDMAKVSLLHFRIKQDNAKDIKKVQIVYRINFLAIFFHKITVNKFWEKEAIETLSLKGSETQSGYELFAQERDAIEKANIERAALAIRAQEEMKEKQIQVTQNSIQQAEIKNHNQQSTLSSNAVQNQNVVSKKIFTLQNQAEQKVSEVSKLQGEYFNFNSLPPQFIHFDVKFIEAMD